MILRVINAALNGREGAALPGQLDAGLHGVIADKFHHLGGKFLPFREP